ncbi:hypothetical protein [Microbulbifer elongatus]|uniref:hypothetical protein n=1 Tax=Microbulbifer elongatus TaxID=86173 RepID=UPI001E4764D5|nr:hypothetical protein [Microbulbifer elongatus]
MQQEVARPFSEYVFLSKETIGKDGRRVFIDPNLLAPYLEFVQEDDLHGQQTLRKMIGLKNSAAGITSQSNQSNAHQHRLDCGSVMVTYSVLQSGAPNSHGDGVYISGLQQSLGEGCGKPSGLYSSRFVHGAWRHDPADAHQITTHIAAVAANYDTKKHSFNLKFTGDSVGDYFAQTINGRELNNEFSLYYCPTSIIDKLGIWKSPEQKVSPEGAGSTHLAKVLIETQNQYWADTDQQHHWYIFGHGAKLLKSALEVVKARGQASLSHHQFSFVEPRSNIGSLLSDIDRLGATYKKTLTMKSLGARYHQAVDADAVTKELQANDKSWTSLSEKIAPAASTLKNAENLKARIANHQGDIAEFSRANFVALVEKVSGNLGWE